MMLCLAEWADRFEDAPEQAQPYAEPTVHTPSTPSQPEQAGLEEGQADVHLQPW